MPRPIQLQFIYNKSSTDKNYKEICDNLEAEFRKIRDISNVTITKARHLDLREPPQYADIQFHIDIPSFVSIEWSPINYFITNKLGTENWNSILTQFDRVIQDGQQPTAQEILESISKKGIAKKVPTIPPVLLESSCPSISVITLLKNRKQFTKLASHNMLLTDYPHAKIEWVVVEDSDNENSSSHLIVPFAEKCPGITISYIPLEGDYTIGEKRNIGIKRAEHDIILFMDDDDHYPVTSFRRRVAWLEYNKAKTIVGCSMIACYNLLNGVSSVHVPSWTNSTASRISEATLTFRKSAWLQRPFEHTNINEGTSWIEGRECQLMEIPPQQIIVAFIHSTNMRKDIGIVDKNAKPSCFWGFPREYLEFIHGLAGIKVEGV